MRSRWYSAEKSKDFSCCSGCDFVGPGTCKVARLDGNEGMKMYLAKLYFFILLSFRTLHSCFHFWPSYYFFFLLFLKNKDATNPCYSSRVWRQHVPYTCTYTVQLEGFFNFPPIPVGNKTEWKDFTHFSGNTAMVTHIFFQWSFEWDCRGVIRILCTLPCLTWVERIKIL